MENCDRYLELISAYTDGEISDAEKAELDAHLESCPDCRRVMEAYAAMDQCFDGEVQPPETLAKGIMYKIGLDSGKGKKRRFSFGRGTAAAAVIVLALLGINYLKSNLFMSKGSADSAAEVQMTDAESNEAQSGWYDAAEEEKTEDLDMPAPEAQEPEAPAAEPGEFIAGTDGAGGFDVSGSLASGEYYAAAEFEEMPEALSSLKYTENDGVLTAETTKAELQKVMDEAARVTYSADDSLDKVLIIIYIHIGLTQ